jgi:hypothetical protein
MALKQGFDLRLLSSGDCDWSASAFSQTMLDFNLPGDPFLFGATPVEQPFDFDSLFAEPAALQHMLSGGETQTVHHGGTQ